MSSDIMCNGHKYVKSTLFQSPSYLADLSPYISAVISSRLFATPIQLTASAIKPLGPIAQSILPTRATNYILNATLTCEYCLHQVSQSSFDDGTICPALLLERLGIPDAEFIVADQLIEAQDRRRVEKTQERLEQGREQLPDEDPDRTEEYSYDSSRGGQEDIKQANKSVETFATGRRREEAHQFREDLLIMQICPEVGLHAQGFVCVDCDKEIDLNSSRLCHYDGRYYCYDCHSGSDLLPIPARVLTSWDFTPKQVSKSSLRKICYLRTKPVLFNLFQINSMLYGFIDRLVEIKRIRERIQSMLKYLDVCGQPEKPYLMLTPRHFLDANLLNFFTLNDLFDINQVYDTLTELQTNLEDHIVRKCESCRGKGYYCELCRDPHDVLYPFSKNGATCSRCQTVYHKNCFHRKKKNCPRCARLEAKRSSASTTEQNSSRDSSFDERQSID